jgi:3'(2'), 5'-bisphosphate nucleotidase
VSLPSNVPALAAELARLAAEAGRIILDVAASGLRVREKDDLSPVTQADTQAEAFILEGLSRILPGIPVLAEESASRGDAFGIADTFLVVDPLDGTREFVAGRPEYTVNIGLVADGRAVLGVLCAPALGRHYWGAPGNGAWRACLPVGALPAPADFERIAVDASGRSPIALTSLGHGDPDTEAFLDRCGATERRRLGSALKFALVAEGAADIYARFVGTMEWDTAAGQAIVEAAGGAVLTPEGAPLIYGKASEGFRNGPLIAWGRAPG